MEFTQVVGIMGYWIGGAALVFIGGFALYMWWLRSNQFKGG